MLRAFKIIRLHEEISAVAPVVSMRDEGGINVVPVYADTAIPEQITAGNTVLSNFDMSDAADDAWWAAKFPEKTYLAESAAAAITRLNQIISYPDPTMATLNQVVNVLINQLIPAIRDIARYEKALINHEIESL